jgi:hypothetical protein
MSDDFRKQLTTSSTAASSSLSASCSSSDVSLMSVDIATAKVWSYSYCDTLPTSTILSNLPVNGRLESGSLFEYDKKSCEVVRYQGKEYTVIFYRLAGNHQGKGWIHNFNPNLPGLKAISEDTSCCDINESEWEHIAESSGLDSTFNEDECADAWNQLWGSGTSNDQIITDCEEKRKKINVRSEIEYNMAKPYVCTFPDCGKRYTISRFCRFHPEMMCELDATANGVSHVDFCDICGKDENEDKLLICENCVTGWSSSEEEGEDEEEGKSKKLGCSGSAHSYCVGFSEIPQGDWYCSSCLNSHYGQTGENGV